MVQPCSGNLFKSVMYGSVCQGCSHCVFLFTCFIESFRMAKTGGGRLFVGLNKDLQTFVKSVL